MMMIMLMMRMIIHQGIANSSLRLKLFLFTLVEAYLCYVIYHNALILAAILYCIYSSTLIVILYKTIDN